MKRHPHLYQTPLLTIGLTAVVIGSLLTGCNKTPVGHIGKEKVDAADLKSFYENLPAREQSFLAQDPAMLNQAAKLYIVQQFVLKEATSKQWDQKPEVKAQLERLRQNAIIDSYLQTVSMPPKDFPSDDEIRKVYDASKDTLKIPKLYRLAQIFVSAPRNADTATEQKARSKIQSIQQALQQPNADFGAQVTAWSDDKRTASRGGEIGWVPEEQLLPDLRSVVTALQRGAISDPVRLGDGWHIVKLIDVKDAHNATLEEVRGEIVNRLRAAKAQANRQNYLAKMLDQNPVTVDEAALAKIVNAKAKNN